MALAVVRFDLRRSSSSTTEHPELYRAALDMAAYADEQGYDMLVVSEHHGDEGGYLPSPIVLAAAMAGRTARIPMIFSALLVPLHDPIRLAEDLAVLDLVSGGRIWVVAGLGYRPGEYQLLSKEWKGRGKLLDRALEVMLAAWSGEPFEYNGATVQVRPTPVQQPHPVLFVGGSADAAAKRAARFGLGLFPSDDKPELADLYVAECERLGKTPGMVMMPKGPAAVMVSADPDATWDAIGPLLLEDATEYASHLTPDMASLQASGAQSIDDLRAEGVYRILTPDQCVELNEELGPFGGITLHPLCGGCDPEIGWESLHLFTEQVMPRITGV
jgi:alkanesulfonate monooxygenase SsuD/methylene tetrahydromethanopterin reductase-like flavin-dependent oxidoreductase (luciferase family)